MKTIFVIGGGEIKNFETLAFDKKIVKLTEKKHPKALFIPTASNEAEEYINTFKNVYGKNLGCRTDVLFLLKNKPSRKKLNEKILSSDLIYVGGGNTLKMMRRWRFLGVDKILIKAYETGIVLSGLSAGGICWFEYGHSDSMKFYNPKNWKYIKVRGIGLLKGIHCPHFNVGNRREEFMNFMKKYKETGLALDNHCAIMFINNKFKVLSSRTESNAYKVYKKKDFVIIEKIQKKKKFLPIKYLYTKS